MLARIKDVGYGYEQNFFFFNESNLTDPILDELTYLNSLLSHKIQRLEKVISRLWFDPVFLTLWTA